MKVAVWELLELGILRPSQGPWALPAILVTKKDGAKRLCVDYRRLNAITVKILEEMGLRLKAGKFCIAEGHCQYLGHRVSEGEIRPLEAKVKAIQDYPRPLKKKNLCAFLGLSNYYRRFVLGYGSMVPLTEATRKDGTRRD